MVDLDRQKLLARRAGTRRSPQGKLNQADATHINRNGTGDGRPESESIDAENEAADIDDPGRDEPQKMFGIQMSRFAAPVEIDEDDRDSCDRRKCADERGEKPSSLGSDVGRQGDE